MAWKSNIHSHKLTKQHWCSFLIALLENLSIFHIVSTFAIRLSRSIPICLSWFAFLSRLWMCARRSCKAEAYCDPTSWLARSSWMWLLCGCKTVTKRFGTCIPHSLSAFLSNCISMFNSGFLVLDYVTRYKNDNLSILKQIISSSTNGHFSPIPKTSSAVRRDI